jgi:hypothetical protein
MKGMPLRSLASQLEQSTWQLWRASDRNVNYLNHCKKKESVDGSLPARTVEARISYSRALYLGGGGVGRVDSCSAR